ncbi:MAG: peptidase T [Bacteroidota bacterium]
MKFTYTASERFMRYVQIDTQSDPESNTFPSTLKQKDLSNLLVKELKEMGLHDAHLDEYGYVYATLPSNTSKQVPVICFCSHVDTSPDCSGANVKPIIHHHYQGQDIVLPADHTQVLKKDEHPELNNQIGNDIITADGTTLLGADNKAGVAEIMDAVYQMIQHPEIKHGTIKILFTPDEEIGKGVNHVNLAKLGAQYGYTVDGETAGHIEDETFSADGVILTIHGVSTHPGFAKGKMQSAIKIASAIIDALPKDKLSPESTDKKEGFIHPVSVNGLIEKTTLQFIIRDFETANLKKHEALLEEIVNQVIQKYPGASYNFEVKEQYRNMKEVLQHHPQVSSYAVEAVQRSGLTPVLSSIRGGTDGSRLSFMGLPCPNIFAGEHAFHSKLEWVSVQDMERAVDTIINLARIWEEKS